MNKKYFVSSCTAKSVCQIGNLVIKKHFISNAGINRFKMELIFLCPFLINFINSSPSFYVLLWPMDTL